MYRQINDVATGEVSKDFVQRIADGAFIPINDNSNVDCLAYKGWVGSGNSPASTDPAPEPPPAPMKVLADLLVEKSVVSQSDIDAAEQESGVTLSQKS